MPRIAITGGIGSGKSLVSSMLSRLGYPVVYADDMAKQLMQVPPLLDALYKLLGPSVFNGGTKAGGLNWAQLSNLLFQQDQKKKP